MSGFDFALISIEFGMWAGIGALSAVGLAWGFCEAVRFIVGRYIHIG